MPKLEDGADLHKLTQVNKICAKTCTPNCYALQYLEQYYCCSSSFVVLVAHWNCVTAIYPFANVAIVGTIVNGICIFAEQMHGQSYVGWHKSSRIGFHTAI